MGLALALALAMMKTNSTPKLKIERAHLAHHAETARAHRGAPWVRC